MIEEIKAGALSKAFPGRQFSVALDKSDVADIVWLDGPAPSRSEVAAAIAGFTPDAPKADALDELRTLLTPANMAKLKTLLK